MKLLLVLLITIPAFGQDITDLLAILNAAKAGSAPIAVITGVDGTICQISKVSSPTISALFKCNTSDAKTFVKSTPILSSGTAASAVATGLGQVLCLIGLNPTATPVTMGSLGTVPASGVAYACTGGDGKIINGTIVWP